MMTALKMFFSNIEVLGRDRVPPKGKAVIFVSNHMNQFLDPVMMMRAVGPSRKISFITAEKSMHRPLIGQVARAFRAVPVIRPQDKAVPGNGSVTSIDLDERRIVVDGGNLLDDCGQPGCIVAIKGVGQFAVEQVLSDDTLMFKEKEEGDESVIKMENFTSSASFKVIPKIPQKDVFAKVFELLRNGGSIGIFPEGGSHDNTTLLPLKPGVAVMALGAKAQGIDVEVVAVGMNYLGGHTFRSNCFLDISDPLKVDDALVVQYKSGDKKAAGRAFLNQVKQLLESRLISAPSYKELKALRTARRMYQNNIKLTPEQYVKLSKRFTVGYEKWKNEPEFQVLMQDIHLYNKFAWAQGLKDKDVAELAPLGRTWTVARALWQLIVTIAMCVIVFPLVLPGLLLASPIPLRTRCIVHREMKKALAGSSVKVAARDVAASQKVMTGALMIPSLMLLYTALGLVLLAALWPFKSRDTGAWHDFIVANAWWLIPVFFLVFFPLYVFYVCVVLSERISRRLRHLPSYWLSVTSVFYSNSRNPAEQLRIDRKRLVLRVQKFVEEHLSQVPGWSNDRVITKDEMEKRRSQDTLKVLESGDLTPQFAV